MVYLADKNGQLVRQTYILEDPRYRYASVVMDFRSNETIIQFVRFYSFQPRQSIIIPNVFPDILPKDALHLAERLENLKAFL
jgi:hypothetical protein